MRRFIFICMLAAVSGAWTVCQAENVPTTGNDPIPSLCDEWHILSFGDVMLPYDEWQFSTSIVRLTTDTVINGMTYRKLMTGRYAGALREGDNRDIYFIPANGTHEYLLYAFNAQAGDTLTNLWFGGTAETVQPDGYTAVVQSVSDGSRKGYRISVDFVGAFGIEEESTEWIISWIEGIGQACGPIGYPCPDCTGYYNNSVLCAYKNGEQVYASQASEDFGCYFTYWPRALHQLPMLCDEWNMVVYPFADPLQSTFYYTQRLTTDTIINGKQYRQLRGDEYMKGLADGNYLGALRETYYHVVPKDPSKPKYRNAIFYIPPHSTHEYMLYDFNAVTGDTLRNLWIGGDAQYAPDGYTAVVREIRSGRPRKFVLDLINTDEEYYDGCGIVQWIDSVGFDKGGPVGWGIEYCAPVDPIPEVLCACKDGRKVYTYLANCNCSSLHLNFLCDTWNILGVAFWDGNSHYSSFTQQLTTDTIINAKRYLRLKDGGAYLGAIREDDRARIYYIPAGTTHEYLLYAFQVKVSDSFNNVWFGGSVTDFPNGSKATVKAIEEVNGRKVIKLDVEFRHANMDETQHWEYSWIEGVGLPQGPVGDACPFDCAGDYGQSVLCAFKDGQQVYARMNADDKFGCWYSNEQTADTIPLYRYTGDGPDGSTVDPVDPNQVVVILQGDELTIREFMGEDITYNLEMGTQNNAPAQANAPAKNYASQTFREYVAIQLTEDGRYTLQLTNPEWGYGMVATFNYGHNALPSTSAEQPAAQKILQNGQLLIRQGERMFTPTGMQVGIIARTDATD